MDSNEAIALRDRIRESPQEIRVLCPRGHFIAHLAIVVMFPDNPNGWIWLHPRVSRKTGYVGNIGTGSHGFSIDTSSVEKTLRARLRCTKCRYHGAFNMSVLGAMLAKEALGGHAEYRLTQ